MTSPAQDAAKGLDLQGLLRTLHRDPFSTRKQLPRTPESLSKSSARGMGHFFTLIVKLYLKNAYCSYFFKSRM